MNKDTSSQTPEQQSPNGTGSKSLYRIYDDCGKLPLSRFIDCVLDNNLAALVIEGEPSESELKQAWDIIYLQYCQLSQAGSYNEALELNREIEDLRAKIQLTNACVQVLAIRYEPDVVGLLNFFALRCDVLQDDEGDVLIGKLNMVIGRAKKWAVMLEQKQKQFDTLQGTEMKKIDRGHFDDLIDALSTFKKYQVEADRITVSLFYKGLANMQAYYEKQQINKLKAV